MRRNQAAALAEGQVAVRGQHGHRQGPKTAGTSTMGAAIAGVTTADTSAAGVVGGTCLSASPLGLVGTSVTGVCSHIALCLR